MFVSRLKQFVWDVWVVVGVLAWMQGSAYAASKPKAIEGYPELYQRVLTLPGARLFKSPDENNRGKPISAFSIFYVFDSTVEAGTGQTWLGVGEGAELGLKGWIMSDLAQEWNMMLVMQFAPGGKRSPALFFKSKDELAEVVESPVLKRIAYSLIDSVSGEPDSRLIATEIDDARVGGVSFDSQPYVFPILSHSKAFFNSGQPVTLIEVASVNAKGKRRTGSSKQVIKKALEESTIGVAFVIDTTISMQPYIDGARKMAENIAGVLARSGAADKVKFAAIGYRNNMDEEPQKSGLEYVVKTFLDFKGRADSNALTGALTEMKAAKVSTHSFSEDAIAGLEQAISGLDWEGIDYRFVFLITDAGALDGGPKSKYPELNLVRINERMEQDRIVIFPLHLVTEQAEKAGNSVFAQEQYQHIGRTGDRNNSKYIEIAGGSEAAFQKELKKFESAIAKVVGGLKEGVRVASLDEVGSGDLEDLVINEIFRAQQSMIGAIEGDQAAQFLRGWAVDADLTNVNKKTMQVAVFLTRNQLSDLAQRLDKILRVARRAQTTPDAFFKELQSLAATTSQNPDQFTSIVGLNLLPSYLKLLPYKPDIFKLTERSWLAKSFGEQQAIVDDMVFKIGVYRDIEGSKKWVRLSKDEPGQDIYPLPLEYLP